MSESKLSLSEAFALGEYLSDWNKEDDYETILQKIEDGEEEVLIWHPFEGKDASEIVELIEAFEERVQALLVKAAEMIEEEVES